MRSTGTLQDLLLIYPKVASMFQGSKHAANCIEGADFQCKKERFLMVPYISQRCKLKGRQIRLLKDAVYVGDKQKALGLLRNLPGKESWFPLLQGGGQKSVLSKEEAMWDAAASYATSVSDSRFLSYLKTLPTSNFLSADISECEETAYTCLTTQLDSMVSGVSEHILSTHREECPQMIQRGEPEEEKDLETSRAKFVQRISDSCREHSRSYVVYSSGVE